MSVNRNGRSNRVYAAPAAYFERYFQTDENDQPALKAGPALPSRPARRVEFVTYPYDSCVSCGEYLGPENPRQLCGKTKCYSQPFATPERNSAQ